MKANTVSASKSFKVCSHEGVTKTLNVLFLTAVAGIILFSLGFSHQTRMSDMIRMVKLVPDTFYGKDGEMGVLGTFCPS